MLSHVFCRLSNAALPQTVPTTFNNPSGLDEEKGNISSAYDMAILMSYAMQNEDFKTITGTKVRTVKTNKNVYKI